MSTDPLPCRQEAAIKRTRNDCSDDEQDADYDEHQDKSDSGDSDYSDDDEVRGVAFHHGTKMSSFPSFNASDITAAPASCDRVQPRQHASDPLAGQLARVAINRGPIGNKYENEPVKLLSDSLEELRRGVEPKDALTARIAPAASRLRGYVIDLDLMTEADKHATCL